MKDFEGQRTNVCKLSFIVHPLSLIRHCAFAPLREIYLVAIVAVSTIGTRGLAADNWDRFRGPNGAGQSDAAGIPTQWEPANFLWKQPLPSIGHSSPVIWGGRLFITSGDPTTGAQIVSAFDTATGKRLWEKRFDAGSYHM